MTWAAPSTVSPGSPAGSSAAVSPGSPAGSSAGSSAGAPWGVALQGVRGDGLALFGPDQLTLRAEIEAAFATWLAPFEAAEVELPRLVDLRDAAEIDYFQNFPQLGMIVTGLADPEAVAARARAGDGTPRGPDLAAPAHLLPSAACYGLYFALRGRVAPELSTFTLRGHCFRRERHYQGLDRLLGFTQRELVAVGSRAAVEHVVAQLREVMRRGAAHFGIEARVAAATDPFFEDNGARARMQRLLPVKHELVSDRGVALASTNYHRNFFGERCDIRLADGSPAYSACLGLGVERWLGELIRRRGPAGDSG